MKLEINTDPAFYIYAFYWVMMVAFALSPFFREQETLHLMALSLSLGVVTLLLARSIRKHFKDIKSISINLSPTEFIGGLLIIFGAIAAGVSLAA